MPCFLFLLFLLFLVITTKGVYFKLAKTDLPWLNGTRISQCGVGTNIACNITYLSSECDKISSCSGFNTNGYLKQCASNRCGCQISSLSCELSSNDTDLYLKSGDQAPKEWRDSILNSSLFYDSLLSVTAAATNWEPEIGNGYVGTVPGVGSIQITGLYNGKCGNNTRKAGMPSTLLVTIRNANQTVNALDLKHAKFIKRWNVNNSIIEQTFLAHRKYRHILVMQLSLLNINDNESVQIYLKDGLNIKNGDFIFEIIQKGNYSTNEPMIYSGQLTQENDQGNKFNVTFVKDVIPDKLIFDSNNNKYIFITSLMTTMPEDDNVNNSAMNEYLNARQLIKNNCLIIQHEKEWELLYESGIDIWAWPNKTESDDDIIGKNGIAMNFNTANSMAGHVNASLYYLYSAIRADWNHGASPGGIASAMYHGAVFFDMDFYITPAFLLLNPNISASNLEYRYNGINASIKNAKAFGYDGAMFPWPSAYNGYAIGCCNGTKGGGNTQCLEQHVSGDIGIITWYYYLVTHDIEWLKNRGYPLLSSISNWIISRVTPNDTIKNDTKYDINGVIPVDEWADNAGCGCTKALCNNDVQTNAVCKLTLKYTIEAIKILNISHDNITLYDKISTNIPILFNDTHNRHNEFNSIDCPNGFGGTHYSPGATICPEDILYLSYPLNPDELNISSIITKNDYDFFVPRTCQENAGMTTPIHTIVQTMLIGQGIGNINFMEKEFNRSMYGACYGPYNIRNEIDKHPNIVIHGSHEENHSHFITGDGGFIQQFIYGFSGIKIVGNGLKLQKPYLPNKVYKMRLRKLFWRNFYLNIQIISNNNLNINIISGNINNIYLYDNNNNSINPNNNNAFHININTFKFPGLLTDKKL